MEMPGRRRGVSAAPELSVLSNSLRVDNLEMIEITYPDGSKQEIAEGSPIMEIVSGLPQSVRKKAIAARIGGRIYDLQQTVEEGGEFEAVLAGAEGSLDELRHSTSHLMALAIKELFPGVKFAIGPSIKDGFYYDVLMEHRLSLIHISEPTRPY